MEFKKSYELLERAMRTIPFPWNQTFSKGVSQYVKGTSPVFAEYGKGPYLFDVDGNRYLDLVMGLMPVILGYVDVLSFERVLNLSFPNVHQHPIYSLPHPNEVELSELLCEIIPCAEMVRLGKNGSDATSAAVRLARAITGRDKILCCGYHGWHDWYVGITGRNKGVPEDVKKLTVPFEYNDFKGTELLIKTHKPACVIMEAINFAEPKEGYLQSIREWCDENGSLLIFDEMITGFRFALGGAQEYFKIIPDLACFGKSMANGWPISAVVGRKDLMKEFGNLHFSGTFFGETYSMQAAISTINYIKQHEVISHLWGTGEMLKNGLEKLLSKHKVPKEVVCLEGYPVWTRLRAPDSVVKSFISQELIRRGILWLETFNLSYSHKGKHINVVLEAFDEILGELMKDPEAIQHKIRGEMISARTVRDRFAKKE